MLYLLQAYSAIFFFCSFSRCLTKAEERIERQLGNAAATGNVSLVKQLLAANKGIDINWVDNQVNDDCDWSASNSTALLRATKCNQSIEVIVLLVEAGANISRKDSLQCTPMLWAAWNGNIPIITYLWFRKWDVFGDEEYKTTVFLAAILGRRVSTVQLLLAFGFKADSSDKDGTTALMYAAMNGYLDVAQILVDNGADCNKTNKYGKTAQTFADDSHPEIVAALKKMCSKNEEMDRNGLELGEAASANDIEKVKRLLAYNHNQLDVNWRDPKQKFVQLPGGGGNIFMHPTALLRAIVKHGNLTMIKLLVDAGAEVNGETGGLDQSPLMAATTAQGGVRIVKYLISRGADVNQRMFGGTMALRNAIFFEKIDIIQLLIDNGASVSDPNYLAMAAEIGNDEIVKLLLANGANSSLCKHQICRSWNVSTSTTPAPRVWATLVPGGTITQKPSPYLILNRKFHQAVIKGNLTLIKEMLSANYNASNQSSIVDVNWVDTQLFYACSAQPFYESTALVKAVTCHQSSQLISTLIDAGANINYSPYEYPGMTPLMVAVRNNDIPAVRLLLDRNATTNGYNSNGESVLMLAAKNGSAELVSILLNKPTNHELIWGKGRFNGITALHVAAMNGNTAAVRALLDRFPGDVNVVDGNTGETALSIAANHSYTDIVKFLTTMYGVTLSKPTVVLTTLRPNTTTFATTTRRVQTEKETLYRRFHDAVVHGNLSLINEMLSYNGSSQAAAIDVNWVDTRTFTACGNLLFVASTALLKALNCRQSLQIISGLIEAGANVNYSSYEYPSMTPLMVAVYNNDIATVRLLLKKKASTAGFDSLGESVLMLAAKNGSADMMTALLNQTSTRTSFYGRGLSNGRTALIVAAMNGNTEAARVLLSRFSDLVDIEDLVTGKTALSLALENGYNDTAKVLLPFVKTTTTTTTTSATTTTKTTTTTTSRPPSPRIILQRQFHRAVVLGNLTLINEMLVENNKSIDINWVDSQSFKECGSLTLLESTALLKAVKCRASSKLLSTLIGNGANVNYSPYEYPGMTPLMLAVYNNDIAMVRLLLDKKAAISGYTSDGDSIIMLAAVNGSAEMLAMLLNRTTNHRLMMGKDRTALHIAARNGNAEAVRAILDRFPGDVNLKDGINGATALITAAQKGNKEIMEILLSRGADITAEDNNGTTALQAAASSGKSSVLKMLQVVNSSSLLSQIRSAMSSAVQSGSVSNVKKLLESGVSANLTIESGDYILSKACMLGRLEIAKLLIENEANVNARDHWGKTALMMTVQIENRTDIVRLLLDNGAKVNDREDWHIGNSGWTALMYASTMNDPRYEVMQLLLERGANINQKDDVGETALFKAVQSGPIENVMFLLYRGANVNERQGLGFTPLTRAVAYEQAAKVRLLLENGALTNVTDYFSSAPFLTAIQAKSPDFVNMFLENGIDVNATYLGDAKVTALMYAAREGKTEAMNLILDHGADINAINSKNQTALMMAAENDRYFAVRLLLKRGADRSTCTDMLCF